MIFDMQTTMGNITLELDAEKAPETVKNFAQYVENGFYNGTIFHRVIPNFMVQGGGFDTDMNQKETLPVIKNEASNGLKNDIYTLAMARTNEPHSASSQFFINVKDNDFLNFKDESVQGWGYCVFGKVTAGTDIVDKMAAVQTGNNGVHGDVPVENIMLESIVLHTDETAESTEESKEKADS